MLFQEVTGMKVLPTMVDPFYIQCKIFTTLFSIFHLNQHCKKDKYKQNNWNSGLQNWNSGLQRHRILDPKYTKTEYTCVSQNMFHRIKYIISKHTVFRHTLPYLRGRRVQDCKTFFYLSINKEGLEKRKSSHVSCNFQMLHATVFRFRALLYFLQLVAADLSSSFQISQSDSLYPRISEGLGIDQIKYINKYCLKQV